MSAKFTPFPASVSLALPPVIRGVEASHSPEWAKPSSLRSSHPPLRIFRGFQGREFYLQFGMAYDDTPAPFGPFPLNNLCGTMTYRSLATHIDGDAGDPPVYSNTRTREYEFNQTVGSYAVAVVETGAFVGYPETPTGDDPATGSYWKLKDDHPTKIGFVRKTLEVDTAYLSGKLDLWLDAAREFRDATQGGYFWGIASASLSESEAGFHAYVSGMKIRTQADISEDVVDEGEPGVEDDVILTLGYKQPFIASASLVRRKNAPYIKDFDPLGSTQVEGWGLSVYKSGEESIELLDLITENKWRDEYGVFDKSSGNFDGMSYRQEVLESLPLPRQDSSTNAVVSEIMFLGRNGTSDYRVTLELGEGDGEDFTSVRSEVLNVVHGVATTFLINQWLEGAVRAVVTKLEERVNPDDPLSVFQEIAFDSGQIAALPTSSCKVLFVSKTRYGVRWGHRNFADTPPESDKNLVEYYLTKRITRSLKAETLEPTE